MGAVAVAAPADDFEPMFEAIDAMSVLELLLFIHAVRVRFGLS